MVQIISQPLTGTIIRQEAHWAVHWALLARYLGLRTARTESSRDHQSVNKRLTDVPFEPHQPVSLSVKIALS